MNEPATSAKLIDPELIEFNAKGTWSGHHGCTDKGVQGCIISAFMVLEAIAKHPGMSNTEPPSKFFCHHESHSEATFAANGKEVEVKFKVPACTDPASGVWSMECMGVSGSVRFSDRRQRDAFCDKVVAEISKGLLR